VNVTKLFGKNIILEDINLNIPYGSIFGIIGISGSGKTTVLRALIGFLKPEKGTVLFQSLNFRKNRTEMIRQFGFAAQDKSFYSKLTVKENLIYFGIQYDMSYHEIEKKIPETLKLVGLEGVENMLAAHLSSGMQKRLDIACAIIHEPKVLILDEPTEDLDLRLRKEILNLLKKINKEKNVTIVLTSHLLREIEPVCSRIAILHNKRIQKIGTIDSLREDFSHNTEIHVESFPGKYGRMIKELGKHKIKAVSKGHEMIIYTKKAESILSSVMNMLKKRGEKLIELDITKPTLEEIFEEITKVQETKVIDNAKIAIQSHEKESVPRRLFSKIWHKRRAKVVSEPIKQEASK